MSDITAVPIAPTRRGVLVLLWIGIALAIALGAWVAFAGQAPSDSGVAFLAKNAREDGVQQTASGLQYKVLSPGSGTAKPTDADVTLVQYEGKLTDGTTFDKSQQPTPMPVAAVVPGFSEALKLMTKGSKYRFWLKPSLGYGDKATGPIPANSVLVFDVELLDFLPEAVVRQMEAQQQMMQGGAPGAVPGPPGPGAPPPR